MTQEKIDQSGYFHSQSQDELFSKFRSSSKGLSLAEAEGRREVYGTNEFAPEKKETLVKKIAKSLIEPMTLILILASLLSFFIIQDLLEALAILGVVVINTVIGLYQEGKAEKAAEELKKILSPQCKVLRDGDVDTRYHAGRR
jgi:Ca2+-transporting ATPase